MSVLVETTLGAITIDLFCEPGDAIGAAANFLQLCHLKAYHGCLFFSVQRDFVAQTGDPTGTGRGGISARALCSSASSDAEAAAVQAYLPDEVRPHLKHTRRGTVSMVRQRPGTPHTLAAQWLVTLRDGCSSLDGAATVVGEVADGWDVLDALNREYCDESGRPFTDVRITHTHVLLDPFESDSAREPPGYAAARASAVSPPPGARPATETVAPRLSAEEAAEAAAASKDAGAQAAMAEQLAAAETHNKAVVLEIIGDLPDADAAPPDHTLFVCKLNPVTRSEDLEIIFARFGDIRKCEIVRDAASGESLCYAFVEFANRSQCEAAYFKMNNVIVDDRRIRVDFSQSVGKLWNRYRRSGKGGGSGGDAILPGNPRSHTLPPAAIAAAVAAATAKAAAAAPPMQPPVSTSRWGPSPKIILPTAPPSTASTSLVAAPAASLALERRARDHDSGHRRRSRSHDRSRDDHRDRDRSRERHRHHHRHRSRSRSLERSRRDDSRERRR